MLQQITGIVLNMVRYSDTNNIVDFYTKEYGRLSLLVPLSRSRRSAVKSVLFQPLSMLELVVEMRPKANLHRVKEAKQWYVFSSLPYDPFKSSIALFLSEFLYRVLREQEADAPLFAYLTFSIQWLDMCSGSFANFHLVFLLRFSRFLGLYPNIDSYHAGDYFDILNGCYSSSCPTHAAFLDVTESAVLVQLARVNYRSMHLFLLSRAERARCLEQILHYYELHVPNFPELKSLSVLKELFS